MNGILTLTRNNLKLTQRAIHSFLRQDIPVVVKAIDNGSMDGTFDWLEAYGWCMLGHPENFGVSRGWNDGLKWFFSKGAETVLVMGNDTWIPEYFYRTLLFCNLPFITGVAVDNMQQANEKPEVYPLEPRPDFSAFCVSRECWGKIGPFDERFKNYCGDCDMHIRAHRLGVPLWKAAVPFYHERSSTMRNASAEEHANLQEQANKDRAMFQQLYGCLPGEPAYEQIFNEKQTVAY
jgi:GT2 family glycosyltransferase